MCGVWWQWSKVSDVLEGIILEEGSPDLVSGTVHWEQLSL